MKAAFLYNFALFVEWPEEAFQETGDSLIIGILGKDPFGPELDDILYGKTVRDKKIVLKRASGVDEAKNCHMLFISVSEAENVTRILNDLKGRPVLLVSDITRFDQRGGMVELAVENKKVKFSINRDASEAAHLKLSSQLLKLAEKVRDSHGGENP